MSQIAWPAGLIGGLLSAIETVDVTLDQMDSNSMFLHNLASSPDPAVPYVILAGNTSITPESLEADDGESKSNQIKRLFETLFRRNPLYVAVDPLFFGQPNDLAVSLQSMESIAGRETRLDVHHVACDHMTYFSHPDGLNALANAIINL